MTGSALRPAGKPLILTVTGPSNPPLRTIFPLTSTVAPGLMSIAGAASSTVPGERWSSVTAGSAKRVLGPGELAFGLQADGHRPQGGRDGRLDRDFPSAALSAIVTFAIVRPGGRGSGEIASAPSAPLVRVSLDGDGRAQAMSDLDRGRMACRGVTGRSERGRGDQAIFGDRASRQRCLLGVHDRLEGEPFEWAVRSLARGDSLIGAAGNLASAAAESESTPAI